MFTVMLVGHSWEGRLRYSWFDIVGRDVHCIVSWTFLGGMFMVYL